MKKPWILVTLIVVLAGCGGGGGTPPREPVRIEKAYYSVTNNPNNVDSTLISTTYQGKMFVANHAGSPVNFWCQTVQGIEPDSTYDFSADGRSFLSSSLVTIEWTFNGSSAFQRQLGAGAFESMETSWESGTNTSVEICGRNVSTANDGPFGIDNISLIGPRDQCLVDNTPTDDGGDTGGGGGPTSCLNIVSGHPLGRFILNTGDKVWPHAGATGNWDDAGFLTVDNANEQITITNQGAYPGALLLDYAVYGVLRQPFGTGLDDVYNIGTHAGAVLGVEGGITSANITTSATAQKFCQSAGFNQVLSGTVVADAVSSQVAWWWNGAGFQFGTMGSPPSGFAANQRFTSLTCGDPVCNAIAQGPGVDSLSCAGWTPGLSAQGQPAALTLGKTADACLDDCEAWIGVYGLPGQQYSCRRHRYAADQPCYAVATTGVYNPGGGGCDGCDVNVCTTAP